MTQKTLGQSPVLQGNTKSGYILIVSVIIITAVLSVIIISAALSSITHISNVDINLRGERARYYTEGCLQEALVQLSMHNDYTGGTLSLAGATCTVNVSGTGNSRDIDIEGTINDYTHTLGASATLSPFSVDVWDN